MSHRRVRLVVLLVVLTLPACGSDPSDYVRAPPGSVTAPSPSGTSRIAGTWVGTFDTSDPGDCHTNTPADATFEEQGGRVTGTLSAFNACGLDAVKFDGIVTEARLEGSLTTGVSSGSAVGTLSDGRLELQISDLRGGASITPSGHMHLHRP